MLRFRLYYERFAITTNDLYSKRRIKEKVEGNIVTKVRGEEKYTDGPMSEGLTPLCAKIARFPIYRIKNDTGCARVEDGGQKEKKKE